MAAAAAVNGEACLAKAAVANAPLARPLWIATPRSAATKEKHLKFYIWILWFYLLLKSFFY